MTDATLERVPGASAGDYIELLKPRVMSLVVFTGLAGLVLAPGHIHPLIGAVAVLCIAVGAGASGAINMWYDRDIDAVMTRTANRPIPSGRVGADEALGFGCTLAVLSTLVMGVGVNWTAAALLALTILFYIVVYTMGLKRRTPQNIVIGGAAGAFPPMIGWAAVTGDVAVPSILLFLLIFLWTPPHFWALALFRNGDYTRAGVPMMPVVAGPRSTKRQMLVYTLVLLPVAASPYFVGIAGPVYLAASSLLGLMFVGCAVRVLLSSDDGPAKKMFGFSILYLFLLFALMIGERLVVGGGA
ncbi:protoheme IX farnesyltransferase [Azospirillum cavernae]|uniref:Protoheme IX farnesyltransferase n=1 Tax=Azospirillum cavernae TaxID=2320860 RepID=A0A418W0Y5_9PROT|nr:heme o synthase [Azospirillum cavernae]RJF83676.1 protoheme IX farnesyltransferase [Azospirillum cavernae]